jgi:hypothetical protein
MTGQSRVVEVDDDVGGVLRVDLGEVAGGGLGTARIAGWGAGALSQEGDQVPGADELGVLEEAAVDHHHLVAGAAVPERGWAGGRSVAVQVAQPVERRPAATASAIASMTCVRRAVRSRSDATEAAGLATFVPVLVRVWLRGARRGGPPRTAGAGQGSDEPCGCHEDDRISRR